MIRKIFCRFNNDPIQSVTSAALIMASAGIISRVLGLIRDRILASNFGAGDTLDAYYAAFRIPDLMFNLLVLGSLGAAFIPVFTELITQKKEKEAQDLIVGMLSTLLFIMMLLSIIFILNAEMIMKLVVPGFSDEKLAMTVTLAQIMFLSPLLLGVSSVLGAVLISHRRFFSYALAPIFYNIGIIIGATVLVPLLDSFTGLAWGVVLGAFFHLMVHYPVVKKYSFKSNHIFINVLKNIYVRKVVKLMIPRSLTTMTSELNLLIIAIFTSAMVSGSLTIFMFAINIQSVPLGMIGIPFAIAAFPTLSTLKAQGDLEEFKHVFSKYFRRILYLVIPLSVLLIVLRAQIVRVLLGAGSFDWEDTVFTFQVLGLLAISLFAQSTIPLLSRAFFALHDTKTPFYSALVSQLVNIMAIIIIVNYGTFFSGENAIFGLAVAFSVVNIVNMCILILRLRKKIGGIDEKTNIISISKIIVAAFGAGIVAQILKTPTSALVNELDTFWEVLFQLSIAGIGGIIMYIILSAVLHIEEFHILKRKVILRIFKKSTMTKESFT